MNETSSTHEKQFRPKDRNGESKIEMCLMDGFNSTSDGKYVKTRH